LAKTEHKRIRVLLIGTGDSGKTTFLKQLKLIHLGSLELKEIEKSRCFLKQNLLDYFNLSAQLASNEGLIDIESDPFSTILSTTDLSEEIAVKISSTYKDAFKQFILTKACYTYHNIPYLLDHAIEIASPNYQPPIEAILLARMKTTGIQEVELPIGNSKLIIVDVGGQRSERRKWLRCFSEVTAVIFIAALDEYDKVLDEDGRTSRLKESLDTFRDLLNQDYFVKKKVILFLNRYDLFKKKISVAPLHKFFEEISPEEGSDVKKAARYMVNLYQEKLIEKNCEYAAVHLTCALDTSLCRKLFSDITEQIITESLSLSGIF